MKCDIHHQKNAHPKTSPTESDGAQQYRIQTSHIFSQYNQIWNMYELKKRDVNQTKLGFLTV